MSDLLEFLSITHALRMEEMTRLRNMKISLLSSIKRKSDLYIKKHARLLEYIEEFKQEAEARAVIDEDYKATSEMLEKARLELDDELNPETIKEGSELIKGVLNKIMR